MQMLPRGDDRIYNVARDLAHNFPEILGRVMRSFSSRRWAELEETLYRAGVDDKELAKAFDSYVKSVLVMQQRGKEGQKWEDMLKDQGFIDCDAAAQVAVFAEIGLMVCGMYFASYEDAYFSEEARLADVLKLGEAAEQFANRVRQLRSEDLDKESR
jgi:hypothetical protein